MTDQLNEYEMLLCLLLGYLQALKSSSPKPPNIEAMVKNVQDLLKKYEDPSRFQPKPADEKCEEKPYDIRLETENYFLKKENARLYEAIKSVHQPPAAPDPETIKLMKEVDDVAKALANGLPPPPPTERCGCRTPEYHAGHAVCEKPDQAVEIRKELDDIECEIWKATGWSLDKVFNTFSRILKLARGGKG